MRPGSIPLEFQTTLKNEVWKPIPSAPNYEASNLGRIRSVFVHVLKPKITHATVRDEPLYELVVIHNRRKLVHRLVAEAFLGIRPEGMIVHHKDHVKLNNKPGNLEYVTPSQNTRLAYADGRIGRTHKTTAFARKKIVELYETGGYLTKDLAQQFRISRSTILGILQRAEVKLHRRRKLTPVIYEEIRNKYVPYTYPVGKLAQEYNVSTGLIEFVLGMRGDGRGNRLPLASKIRTANHPQETELANG